MSHCGRLEHIAIGIGLLIAVLLALVFSELVKQCPAGTTINTDVNHHNGDQDKHAATGASEPSPAVHNKSGSSEYQPDCRSKENADLCAQVRMAQAAENQLWYTRWGFWLLAGTLIAAFWAAWESHRAARSAGDILKAERAWMTAVETNPEFNSNGTKDGIVYSEAIGFFTVWVNSGRSPALNVSMWGASKIVPRNTSLAPFFERKIVPDNTIVGQGISVNTLKHYIYGQDLNDLLSGKSSIIIYSVCTYKDIFSQDLRMSEYCVCTQIQGFIVGKDGERTPRFESFPVGNQNSAS